MTVEDAKFRIDSIRGEAIEVAAGCKEPLAMAVAQGRAAEKMDAASCGQLAKQVKMENLVGKTLAAAAARGGLHRLPWRTRVKREFSLLLREAAPEKATTEDVVSEEFGAVVTGDF